MRMSRSAMIDRNVWEHLPEDVHTEAYWLLRRAMSDKSSVEYSPRDHLRDGEQKYQRKRKACCGGSRMSLCDLFWICEIRSRFCGTTRTLISQRCTLIMFLRHRLVCNKSRES